MPCAATQPDPRRGVGMTSSISVRCYAATVPRKATNRCGYDHHGSRAATNKRAVQSVYCFPKKDILRGDLHVRLGVPDADIQE